MKTTGLNFMEVVRAAKETGCKIRRADWSNYDFVLKLWLGRYYTKHEGTLYEFLQEDFDANDWEIVSELPKTMTFHEMLEMLREGKKVKRLAFAKCGSKKGVKYIKLEDRIFYETSNNNLDSVFTLVLEDIDATDWVIHMEE